MFIRQKYLDILFQHKDKDLIKVVTGIRRCGKSTILKLFAQELLKSGVEHENIIQMSFESI
jgi:predicted AAA+ superfamily ATPase